MRTCIGCRRCLPQLQLVRFVLGEGAELVASRVAIGRGAWLCPDQRCWDVAVKRRAFTRALRCAPRLPATYIEAVSKSGFRDTLCAD